MYVDLSDLSPDQRESFLRAKVFAAVTLAALMTVVILVSLFGTQSSAPAAKPASAPVAAEPATKEPATKQAASEKKQLSFGELHAYMNMMR